MPTTASNSAPATSLPRREQQQKQQQRDSHYPDVHQFESHINGSASFRAHLTNEPTAGPGTFNYHKSQRSSSPVLKRRRKPLAGRAITFRFRAIMRLLLYLIICIFFVATFSRALRLSPLSWFRSGSPDLTKYVDLFRGTENGGNMFPGVVPAPYSVVKFGPDCDDDPPTDAYSGYLPTGNITGFSMMHQSGTGGAPKYGIVSQMPVLGKVENPLLNLSRRRMARDYAEVGYYRSWLQGGIMVELAGTDHAAMAKYSFKAGGFENSIVIDVSHVLPSYRGFGWGQNYSRGHFHILDDGHFEGFGVYNGGWNLSPDFTIYFCGYFDTPPYAAETFAGTGEKLSQLGQINKTSGSERQGGVFTFRDRPVISRVGVSWISIKKACTFVNEEIPEGTSIATLSERSKSRWNKEVLSKITTNREANVDHLRQLYSNLYAMYIIPTNRTGENPNWKSTEPYFDDIVTYWDLFRCSMALTHLITPEAHRDQLRSIIDIYNHEGWLPDARSSDWTGETQGGSNADNILADAFVKGVKLNWTAAYLAVLKDATVSPPNNHDPRAPDSSTRFGRGALWDWETYGYITPTYSRAVSRAIEYAANDFSVYQIAKGLGETDEDVEFYLNRSRNWRNHYNKNQKSLGFKGFLVPRDASGEFVEPYDPLQCGGCYWTDPYYEALPWEYTFAAGHHDMAAVVNLTGGMVPFLRKLQKIFEQGIYDANSAFNGSIINPANEPSFTTPYLFHFADRQDLSVKYSRRMAQFFFRPGRGGLPGNSDSGAMQSWQLWNMIGLYPMVGQRTFLLGSPWFKEMTIHLCKKKKLTITMKGGNVNMEVFYVQSVTVNGAKWHKNWVDWGDVFENGGTIHFEISHTPRTWAAGPPPPSPASEKEYQKTLRSWFID